MPARNSYVLFVLFFSLTAIACNKAQRTPMRESSIEEMLEPAPDHGREAIASGEASTSEAQECLPLHRHITHCLAPGGGTVDIGPLGAVIGTSDGFLTLVIPAAAVSAPMKLTITPTLAPPWTDGFVSHVYDFSPELNLAIPARLSLGYRPSDVPAGISEARLSIFTAEDGRWWRAPSSTVETSEHLVTAPLDRLRTAGALVPLSSLTILTATSVLAAGESASYQARTMPAGRSVSWAISPRTVATIDRATGRLTALAPGRAQIVASAGGVSTASSVTVVAR